MFRGYIEICGEPQRVNLRNLPNGNVLVELFTDAVRLEPREESTVENWRALTYRFEVPARNGLEASITDNFDKWLARAESEARAEESERVRNERNRRISACDYRARDDYPQTEEQRAAWLAYIQALRDVPEQEGFPFEVEWPEKPS